MTPSVLPSIRWRKKSDLPKRRSDGGRSFESEKQEGTFVAKSERVIDGAKDAIVRHYNALQSYVGERPYKMKKISERQQVRRYLLVREDPQQWTTLLQNRGVKATVEYAMKMERLLEKYPDEANYLTPDALPLEGE